MRLLISELLYQVLAILEVFFSFSSSFVLSFGYLGTLHFCTRALPSLSYVSGIDFGLLYLHVSRAHLQEIYVLLLLPLVLSPIVLLF